MFANVFLEKSVFDNVPERPPPLNLHKIKAYKIKTKICSDFFSAANGCRNKKRYFSQTFCSHNLSNNQMNQSRWTLFLARLTVLRGKCMCPVFSVLFWTRICIKVFFLWIRYNRFPIYYYTYQLWLVTLVIVTTCSYVLLHSRCGFSRLSYYVIL